VTKPNSPAWWAAAQKAEAHRRREANIQPKTGISTAHPHRPVMFQREIK